MNTVVDKIQKGKCTGCKMCGDLCPKNAIEFTVNEEGYWYPQINEQLCVNCGMCVKKCPMIAESPKKYISMQRTYASWSNNEQIRRESTSGGVYYEFAQKVLEESGYIVGSVYNDDYTAAYHIYSDSEEGLKKIMGSKYFQSDTAGIYEATLKLIKTGKTVLFTGTPCQVSALKNYLGEEYSNLITIDFICRGVPSPLMQKKKIELYENKNKSKVIFYRDKWKKDSWTDFGELVKFDNGKVKFISRWKDDINDCFIDKNLNLRESCYSCEYKNGNNASDITIGDFWGVKGVTEKDYKMGVSALIVNTEKGQGFIESLGKRIYLEKRTIEEIKRGNQAYIEAAKRPQKREVFFRQIEQYGLEKTVKMYTNKSFKKKLAIVKKLLKVKYRRFIPILKTFKRIDWFKFFKYNYFCSAVHREKDAYIIPCKGSVMQISPNANLIIKGNVLLNYYPCYKRGSQTTLLKVDRNGTFIANNRLEIAYGNTISVDKDAILSVGYFFTGVNANVICHHKISIGNNVMIGRDVCLFDSDYHTIFNENGEIINDDKEVIIEDDSWIGARTMVLKGSHIHSGAIISANSMVMGDVEANRVFVNKRESKSIGGNIIWER